MRHLHGGRKLGVGPDRRRALLRSLTLALIERETIQTTRARAKELRWFADRLVTLAKRGDLSGRRHIVKILGSTQTQVPGENRIRNAVDRIYTVLVPRFQGRNGGYTQIFHLATRRAGDNAEMCVMRYIPAPEDKTKKASGKDKAKAPTKKTDKKVQAAAADKPARAEKAKAEKVEDKKTAKPKKKDKEE